MSIRIRLMLVNILVFALTLGIFGFMVRVQVESKLIAGIDRQLHRERPSRPRRTSSGITLAELQDNFLTARVFDPEAPAWPFYLATGVNALDGRSLPRDPRGVKLCVSGVEPAWTTHNGYRTCTTKVKTSSGPELYVQRSESLASVHAEVNRLTRTLLTMIPIALVLAGAAGMFLTGGMLAPVRRVTEAAARIGADDLSERLPIQGKDEFAQLGQTFNGMLARLEAAFERQRRFVADASHELKTPLTVIKANSSLALADPELTPDYRETLQEIDQAADRTSRIVQDLLVLARTDHGQLPLQEEELSLTELFTKVISEAEKLHKTRPTIHVSVGTQTLWGDPHLLHRLLLNLLDNALRHTPPEGQVSLVALPNGFSVQDTGEGIASEHLKHVGERFYRVDSARARTAGGTGLGLAISRAIVASHGGSFTIESTLGVGTKVTVTLAHSSGQSASASA